MKIAQRKLFHFKEYRIALLFFFLPFLPYIYILNDRVIWEYLKGVTALNNLTSFYPDLSYVIYYIVLHFSIFIISLLIFNLAKNWIRPYLLFPLYLYSTKLLSSIVIFFVTDPSWYVYYLILFPLFIFLFIKQFKACNKIALKETKLNFTRGFIFFLLIGVLFLHELWRFFPEGTQFLNVFSFKLSANDFNDANQALYYYSQRICFLIPVIIYFFIEKKWYRYALLSPILIYATQLYNGLFSPTLGLDEIEIFQTLHFTIPLLIVLVLLTKASDNQRKIQSWANSQYILLERSLQEKFERKDIIIKNSREELKNKSISLEGLKAIKTKLESETRQ